MTSYLKPTWNSERETKLSQLWAEGHVASKIARMLQGVSRSAVIAKAHRMKLARRDVKSFRKSIKTSKPLRLRPDFEIHDEIPIPDDIAPDTAVQFANLEHHHCRWPYGSGPFLFCGCQRVLGQSYCEGHLRKAAGHVDVKPPTQVGKRVKLREFA